MAREKKNIRKQKNQAAPAEPSPAVAAPDPAVASEPGALPDWQGQTQLPIVGIGASAGGLAAFQAFFSAMPVDTDPGMAFVLVQHLSPDHKSILTDLIKRCTRMEVREVEDGTTVQPNRVYIIPPNRDMAFLNGTLQLLEPVAPRGLRFPIDFFFRSLALGLRERAICIVLSGTGSDGALGVRAIKGEGGLVIAQAPESTQYDGMPQSAIATGLVDDVLAPAEMPAQLIAYVARAFGKGHVRAAARRPKEAGTLKKICIVLRDQTGHDFSNYKQNTLVRRVERRMAIHRIDRAGEYLRYLQKSPQEADTLFRDLLIGVTSFFRDPEAFEALGTQAIPQLLTGKPAGGVVRVWVCGSSTGEEAYTIAILLQEHLEGLKQAGKVQIFATDIDRLAIEKARSGVFPASIAADITPERLARFFVREPDGGAYRIQAGIRNLLIFSEQNVLKDPPFSKLDLISCRNLLIYLNGEIQKKLIALFHCALNRSGAIFLGTSETVGEFLPLFEVLDRKWKIYRKKEGTAAERTAMPENYGPCLGTAAARQRQPPAGGRETGRVNLRALTEQGLLQHNNQAGVLVTRHGEILHISGRTGRYLEPASGDISASILPMARKGLRQALTSALQRAVVRKEPVRCPNLRVRTNGGSITVHLTVQPATGPHDLFLVILEEQPPAGDETDGRRASVAGTAPEASGRIAALEQELRVKETYLQTTLEEMETTNEELQSTNEEMQSINEELETSKEELQSVNEELSTVNAELQTKVADLSRANNDMNNLLAGTGVATLFVDRQLRISRFTPSITRVINLIDTDVGRPVTHIVSNLKGDGRLAEEVQAVLETLTPREAEVCAKEGTPFLMRIQPYRTQENVIEGAVITFVDISETKRLKSALRDAHHRLCADIVATVREPLIVLDKNLHVVLANRAFYTEFQETREATQGRLLYELGNRQWDIPELRRLMEKILVRNTSFDNFEVAHRFEHIGRRTMRLNARRIFSETGDNELILLAIEDLTESAPPPQGETP